MQTSAVGQGDDELSVQVVSADRTTTVFIAGEIDVSNTDELFDVMTGELELGCDALWVDAGGITFIASAGVRTFVLAQARASKAGVAFGIVNPSRALTRVIEIIGGGDLLTGATKLT